MRISTLTMLAGLTVFSTCWAEEDPYLWLEGIDDEKALEWVRQQNESTAQRLKSNPIFNELYSQAKATLNASSRLPSVYQEEGWLYNFWKDENNPRGIFRRTSLAEFAKDEPEWEVVIDIDALGEKENKQWDFKGMDCLAKKPEHCMVSLSPGGGDAVVMREFDSVSKTFVEDGFQLPLSKGNTDWIDVDTLFVSTNFGEGSMTESGYPRIVKRWKRGTPLSAAETIHEGDVSSLWSYGFRMRSTGDDIDMVLEGLTFWTSQRYQLIDGKKHTLNLPETAVVNGAFQGRLILSLKDDWAHGGTTYRQGSVLIADTSALRNGGKGQIDILVQPDASTVVEAVSTTDSTVLVTVLEKFRVFWLGIAGFLV